MLQSSPAPSLPPGSSIRHLTADFLLQKSEFFLLERSPHPGTPQPDSARSLPLGNTNPLWVNHNQTEPGATSSPLGTPEGPWSHRRSGKDGRAQLCFFWGCCHQPQGNLLGFFLPLEKQDDPCLTALLQWGRCVIQKRANMKQKMGKFRRLWFKFSFDIWREAELLKKLISNPPGLVLAAPARGVGSDTFPTFPCRGVRAGLQEGERSCCNLGRSRRRAGQPGTASH